MKSSSLFRVNKLILSALITLIIAASAFSQAPSNKPTIAVIPFAESGTAKYGGAELAEMLSNELAISNKFAVVEKAKASAVEPDLKKGPKDTIDPATAVEIGRKTGAQFLVLGIVSDYSEKVKVTFTGVKNYEAFVKFSIREIDAATGEVIYSQTFEKRGVSVGEAKSASGTFASKAMQDAVTKAIKDAAAALVKKLG